MTSSSTPKIDPNLADRVLSQIDESETIDFLRKLIQAPTVNPPGDVRAAISLCSEKLRGEGFSIRTVQLEESKPNLIAELRNGSEPVLCFNAHVDVVPTGDRGAWSHDPFAADVVDGKVYGRGAGDDKASVTAQVMAGAALARSRVPLAGTLVVNSVADEEIGGPAGAALVVDGGHIRPDFVIVGEQTMNRICVGEKGFAPAWITVRGRAAHGALPWEGANAIEAMSSIVSALRERLWPELARRTHPFFHPSTASINMVSGGLKENVVPDYCRAYVDRRIVPGEEPEACLAEIRDIAKEVISKFPGTTVEVGNESELRPATMSDPGSPIVQAMLSANRYLGLDTDLTGFSMATDGRFFVAAGYPTIIYGPGDPKLAHIPDEWVGVDEVIAATKAYALAALALLSKS